MTKFSYFTTLPGGGYICSINMVTKHPLSSLSFSHCGSFQFTQNPKEYRGSKRNANKIIFYMYSIHNFFNKIISLVNGLYYIEQLKNLKHRA